MAKTDTLPPIKFTKKDQLVAALEARRSWAEQYDKKRLAEHKKAEQAEMQRVRDAAKTVARMTYADMKALYEKDRYSDDLRIQFDPPSCPTSMVAALDKMLNAVQQSHQETWTVRADGGW